MKVSNFGVNVTKKCNIDCDFCLCGDPKNESIHVNVIQNMFNSVDEIGELYLTGGEPLLEPDLIISIKDEIKKRNLKIQKLSITTNSTIFNSKVEEALLYFFEGYDSSLIVSVDEFHERAIERLYKRKNMKYDKNTVLMLIKKYYDFCKENNIKFKKSYLEVIALMGRAVNLDQNDIEFPVIFVDNEFNALGNYSPVKNIYDDIVTVDTTGNVLVCDYENSEVNKLSIGNIVNDTLENIIYRRCKKELLSRGFQNYNESLLKTAMEYYYRKRKK